MSDKFKRMQTHVTAGAVPEMDLRTFDCFNFMQIFQHANTRILNRLGRKSFVIDRIIACVGWVFIL